MIAAPATAFGQMLQLLVVAAADHDVVGKKRRFERRDRFGHMFLPLFDVV